VFGTASVVEIDERFREGELCGLGTAQFRRRRGSLGGHHRLNWRPLSFPETHRGGAWIKFCVTHYNLCRVHEALRITPAVASGIADG
jgi:hypothetical protein